MIHEDPCPWCGGTIRSRYGAVAIGGADDGEVYIIGKCDGCNAGSIALPDEDDRAFLEAKERQALRNGKPPRVDRGRGNPRRRPT